MTSLSNAIKVAIQATKESASTPGIHHTALLNDVASRLGFKNFRALVNQEQKSGGELAPKGFEEALTFDPFTIHCYTSDDFASTVSLEVTADMLNRARKFSLSAKEICSFIPFPTWSETPMDNRMTVAARMVMHADGTITLDADLFDKHMSSSLSTYGEVNLESLCLLAAGAPEAQTPYVTKDYIWDFENRDLYLLSDVNDPEDWIDESLDCVSELIEQYHSL